MNTMTRVLFYSRPIWIKDACDTIFHHKCVFGKKHVRNQISCDGIITSLSLIALNNKLFCSHWEKGKPSFISSVILFKPSSFSVVIDVQT